MELTFEIFKYLGSHIYKIIGFNAHDTILGERNNKIVVGCKDFEVDGKKLLEIRTLKNHTNDIIDGFIDEGKIASEESHMVDLEEILIHITYNDLLKDIPDIKQRFFEQIIVDIFINNNDRNNGNWGILRESGKTDILAPIFDNGGSFNTKIPEDKIKRLLSSPELTNQATNVLTVYSKNEHQLNAEKLIKEIEDISEFQEAVKRVIPLIVDRYNDIINMMNNIPSKHVLKNGTIIDVFSDERRELYKKQLSIRLEKILLPLYEKFKDIDISLPPLSTSSDTIDNNNVINVSTNVSTSVKTQTEILSDYSRKINKTIKQVILEEKARVQHSFEHIVKQIEHSFGFSR